MHQRFCWNVDYEGRLSHFRWVAAKYETFVLLLRITEGRNLGTEQVWVRVRVWLWVVGRDEGSPDGRAEIGTYLEGESGSGPVVQPVIKGPLRISVANVSQNLSCLHAVSLC